MEGQEVVVLFCREAGRYFIYGTRIPSLASSPLAHRGGRWQMECFVLELSRLPFSTPEELPLPVPEHNLE